MAAQANPIGRDNMRKDVFPPLRLDPYETSQKIASGSSSLDPNIKLCLPKGMELIQPDSRIEHSQLRLGISTFYAAANRRVFGFVTDLLRTDSINTSSPLMVTAVIKLPFVYWSKIDQPKSWVYVRVIAYSSQAATTEPIAITVGDPITGIVVNTSSKYKTAQLIGWEIV